MTIQIPKQLQDENFRFVLLKHKSKQPFEERWQDTNNYKYNDEKLLKHIDGGGNYGVIGGYGNLRVIDIDDNELSKKFLEILNTFNVKTGGQGMHFYIICEYDINHVFKEKKGELRANNYQVVGPSCIHPNNNIYNIINDIEIRNLTEKELLNIISPLLRIENINIESEEEQIKVDLDFIKNNILSKLGVETSDLILSKYNTEHLKNLGLPSRSERDQKVITTLLFNGFGKYIKSIFEICNIGDKYHEHPSKEKYLQHSIKAARVYSGVEDDYVAGLLKELESIKEGMLRNKIEKWLIKINKIDNWLIRYMIIGDIAFKIKTSKKDLLKRAEELQSPELIKSPILIKDLLKKPLLKTEYWIDNLIPKNSRLLIGGKPGTFKSMFALYLALSITQKCNFLNNFNINHSSSPKILFYDLENGENILLPRLKYIVKGIGIKEEDVDNISIVYDFNKQKLEKEVQFSQKYDIIILDSFRRFLKGSENESEITDKFFNEFIAPLKNEGKTIIILHHFKKSKVEDYEDDMELMDLFRGSGDIPAQFDAILGMFKKQEFVSLDNKIISFDVNVRVVKNRAGLPLKNFNFRVGKDDENLSSKLEFMGFGSPKSPKERIKDRIINIIKEKDIEKKMITDKIRREFRCSEGVIDVYLKELTSDETIFQPKYGIYSITKVS